VHGIILVHGMDLKIDIKIAGINTRVTPGCRLGHPPLLVVS
jgi:hypothetical protein